jgi:hypothetical protein
MVDKITRKFYKPLKGTGELRLEGQPVAAVEYYLQGWRDFRHEEGESAKQERFSLRKLSGLEGEITLGQEHRSLPPQALLDREFRLISEKGAEYVLTVYKARGESPAEGRYGVKCKLGE